MTQLFEGKVYEILPLSNGILFSYQKEVIDTDVVVAYKMLSFESGRITDIAKNIYLLSKFGSNYKAVAEHCDNYITTKSLVLAGGKVFLLYTNGNAVLLDNDVTPVWSGNLSYRTCNPSDFALFGNALWTTFPGCNVLIKYSLTTMREEVRIGGKVSPFLNPSDIFIDGSKAIISNADAKNLVSIDLNTFEFEEIETFDQPVLQFVKAENHRFVILESGLYLI